jgi:hypothetical protein
MERRTAVLLFAGAAVASVATVASAVVLGRSRTPTVPPTPAPAVPATLGDLAPAEAWRVHEARLAAEPPADAGEAEAQRERWSAEAADALARWEPRTAEDRLAVARFWDEQGRGDRALPLAEAAAKGEGETALAAGRLALRLRLEAQDPEGARAMLFRLRGKATEDDLRPAEGAVFEASLAAARRRVEGPRPDLDGALRALSSASGLARTTEDATAEEDARAYVSLSADPAAWRSRLEGLRFPQGAQVVVVSDHFSLGEDVLASVLGRWAERVPVSLVGRLTGEVREGVRREKAGPMGEQRRFTKRAEEIGATLVGAIPAGGLEERALGLRGPGAWVFVVDADSRLVARVFGPPHDPRPLEPLVERLR